MWQAAAVGAALLTLGVVFVLLARLLARSQAEDRAINSNDTENYTNA